MKDIKRLPTALVATLFSCLTAACLAAGSEAAPAEDPHAGISCAKCHLGVTARAMSTAGTDDADPRSRACRACHRDVRGRGATAMALGFHSGERADCAGCHTFHQAGRLKSAVGEVRLEAGPGQSATSHCAGCHVEGARLAAMTGAHRTAATLYHEGGVVLAGQTPSQGCLNCHSAGAATDWQKRTVEEPLAFSEHATHPIGIPVVAGSGQDERRIRGRIDPRLRLFDGRIECQTCHSLSASTADLLVEFATPRDLCLGCHDLRNAPDDHRKALMATMMSVPDGP
jgi:predicted CXXCH cytochrome family protein